MAHDKVFGICENKCLVPVAPKTDTDEVASKVDGFDSRIRNIENVVNGVTSLTVPVTTEAGFVKVGEATYNTVSGNYYDSIKGGATVTIINNVAMERTLSKPEYISFDLPTTKEVKYSNSGIQDTKFVGTVMQNGTVIYTHNGAVTDVSITITLGVPLTVTVKNGNSGSWTLNTKPTIQCDTESFYIA